MRTFTFFAAACASPERGAVPAASAPGELAAPAPALKRLSVVVANEPAAIYYTVAPLSTRGSAGIIFDHFVAH